MRDVFRVASLPLVLLQFARIEAGSARIAHLIAVCISAVAAADRPSQTDREG